MNAVLNINVRVAAAQANAMLKQLQGGVNGLNGSVAAGGRAGGIFANALNPDRMVRFGKNLQWTGQQLMMNFTLPILAAGGAATKFQLDNERAMVQVRKVYGDASQGPAVLKGELDALGKSFELLSSRFGVNQAAVINIAGAWAEAGSGGVALAKSTKLTLQTMILGEMDATKATEGLIAIQSAFRLSTDQLTNVIAGLNSVENITGITLQGLVEVIARAGGTARTAGVSIKELAAMAAALVPAAGSAAQAGNSLRTIISRIMAPTKEAGDLLAQMGIDIMGAGWQSKDAYGRIQTLSHAFMGLSDSQKTVVSSAIASRWQLNRFDILMEAVDKNLGFFGRAIGVTGNSLDDFTTKNKQAADVMNKELLQALQSNPQQLQILWNVLKNTLSEAVEPLIPHLVILASKVVSLVTAFTHLNPHVQQMIVVGLLLLAALGPLAKYLGAINLLLGTGGQVARFAARMLIGHAISAEAAAAAAAANAAGQTAVNGAMVRQGGILQGLYGLYVRWWKFQNGIRTALAGFWAQGADAVGRAVSVMAGTVASFAQSAVSLVVSGAQAVASLAVQAATAIGQGIVGAFSALARAVSYLIVNGIGGTWIAVAGRMYTLWTSFTAAVATAWEAVAGAIGPIWYAANAMIVTAWSALVGLAGTASTFVAEAWYAGAAAITVMWATASEAWLAIQITFSQAMAGMWRTLPVLFGIVSQALGTIWLTLQTTMFTAASELGPALARLWRTLPMLMGIVGQAIGTIWLSLQVAMYNAFSAMKMAVSRGFWSLLAEMAGNIVLFITGITAPMWGAIAIIAAVIAAGLALIQNFYDGGIRGLIEDIGSGFNKLPQIIANAFRGVIRVIQKAIEIIRDQLSYLNPFARHSPSLVDNVTSGIGVILSQYARLRGIPNVLSAAITALQKFNDASKGGTEQMAAAEYAKQRTDIGAVSPEAVPAADDLYAALQRLRPVLKDIGDEVDAQQGVVDTWKVKLDAANAALDQQENILRGLRDAATNAKDALSAANEQLDALRNIPLQGWHEMQNAIFDNEMAQKKLRLEILRLEDAGQSVDDLNDKLSKMRGEIEMLKGESNDLRLAGAGSDILAPYDDQIKSLQDMEQATMAVGSPITDLQKQLDELNRQGQMMDLESSLQFDPLQRQLDAVGQSMDELPFDQLYAAINSQVGVVNNLEGAWKDAETAADAQQQVVDGLTASRDALKASYDAEVDKLGQLKDAYSAVEDQIRAMQQALDSFASSAASVSANDLSQAQQLFDAGQGFNFDDIGGTTDIGPQGDVFDINAFNKQMEDDLKKALDNMGKGMDPFKFIKDGFKKAWDWVKSNAKNIIVGAMIVVGAIILEAISLPVALVVEGTALLLYAMFGPGVFGAIARSMNDVIQAIWQFLQKVWEPIGNIFTAIFEVIGHALAYVWDNTIKPIFGLLGDLIMNVVVPVLKVLGTVAEVVFRAIGTALGWLWNNVIDPIFGWIGRQIGNYVVPILQLFAAVGEIVFVSLGRLIGGFGGIVAMVLGAVVSWVADKVGPVFNWLWQSVISPVLGFIGGALSALWNGVLFPVFSALIGFIQTSVAPVFGWLWHSIIEPVMNGIGGIISSIWGGITNTIKTAANFFISAFNTIAKGIKKIGDFLHISVSIDEMPQIGAGGGGGGTVAPSRMYHTGGWVSGEFGGPGLRPDEQVAKLQRGEYVVDAATAKELKEYGGPDIGKWFSDRGQDAANVLGAVRKGAVMAMAQPFLAAADAVIGHLPDGPFKAGAGRIKNDVYDWLKGADSKGYAEGVAGNGGIDGSGFAAIIRWFAANGHAPYRVTSTFRPFDPGYHGMGRAADFAGPVPGRDSPELAAIYRGFLPVAKTLRELIYAGPGGGQWKNGSPFTYSAAVQADHHDHVHAALRNGGNVLRRGRFLIGEDGPEIMDIPGGGRVTPLDHSSGATVNHLTFSGDLSFPNITNGDDAEAFVENLLRLANG